MWIVNVLGTGLRVKLGLRPVFVQKIRAMFLVFAFYRERHDDGNSANIQRAFVPITAKDKPL